MMMSMRLTKANSLALLRERGLNIATVIDIGVHRHTPELIRVFPDLPHLLFEPVTDYHDDIRSNYQAINYTLFPVALSDASSEGYLETYDITGQGAVTHSSISTSGSKDARQIHIASLDDVLKVRNEAKPYLLKVDVDGAELQILRGATETLKDCSCIVIECPISIDDNQFFDRANFLKSRGFVLWDIVDMCYYKDQLSQVDLVFISASSKIGVLAPWTEGPFEAEKWNTMFQ
jgi:FkbM family methyltransferase